MDWQFSVRQTKDNKYAPWCALIHDPSMTHPSPTSILLNIGHAMDHWILVVFAYSWGVIAGGWGVEWTELTPFNYGALFMFGAGSIVSGRLGDHWGRWIMMVIFFAGMGVAAMVIAL